MSQAKKDKTDSIAFRLREIELIESRLKHPEQKLPDDISFHFNIDLEYRAYADQERLLVLTKIRVSNEADKDTELGAVTSVCTFEFQDLKERVTDEGSLDLPLEIKHTLNSVSLATTRGILYSEFRGTFLQKAIVPLLDMKALTKEQG